MTRRVAAIDCGTNSIRLLVADVDAGRLRLRDLYRDMRIVRLGEGVDQTGRLSPAALDRTMAALGEYAAQIRRLAPEAVRMVATSATRDAENSQEFTTRVKE
ncbi:MAG: exopolyphosphatase, partial [Actinomycetia bacterium]|nr:exopolyphosphatase [Actinomycetes bacterium]